MEQDTIEWLKRGKQKSAVVRVLNSPMTVTEIRDACGPIAPCIQLRDIWLIIRKLVARDLVACLTPGQLTGKIYTLTKLGRAMAGKTFGTSAEAPDRDVDWKLYSYVVRAKARKAVFVEVCAQGIVDNNGKTASAIKKALRERCPMTLDAVRRAIKELLGASLICEAGRAPARNLRLLEPTDTGQRLRAAMTAPRRV